MNGFLIALLVACEVGFWCLLGAGLVTRYLLRLRRTSAVLLAGAPVLDLVLLIASVLDLRAGSTAGAAHGLAAVYIGFSVAFGPITLRWADQRFAHHFAGGPPPVRPPNYGQARARYEWRLWARALAGWAVACGLLGLAILAIDDSTRTAHLTGWINGLTVCLIIWFLAWPLPWTLWPKNTPTTAEPRRYRLRRRRPAREDDRPHEWPGLGASDQRGTRGSAAVRATAPSSRWSLPVAPVGIGRRPSGLRSSQPSAGHLDVPP